MNNIMHNIDIIMISSGNYLLKGDLTFSNINNKTTQLLDFEHTPSSITLDLQQLVKIDSAGLALLIEWVKIFRNHAKELRFDNIPAQLTALAKLSYITETDLFTTLNT